MWATTLGTIAALQANRATAEAERAELEAARAEGEARSATARRLAGDSALALAFDPELAVLLALESAYLSQDASEPLLPETIAALQQSTQTSRLLFLLDGAFSRVAISPDGSLLASMALAGDDSPGEEVLIWDAVTGEPLVRLPGELETADVAFSPDGKYVVTGSQDSTVRVWLWQPG